MDVRTGVWITAARACDKYWKGVPYYGRIVGLGGVLLREGDAASVSCGLQFAVKSIRLP